MESLRQFSHMWSESIDPRISDLPLVASSYQVPLIIFAYLYFVLRCGPRFMKNREPYTLKTFIKWYNVIQVIANAWVVYDCINCGLFRTSLICPPELDYSYEPTSYKLSRNAWLFFMLKIVDYVDTIMFVLRKKTNQVTVLHVYHHVSTLFITWVALRYLTIPPMIFNSMINSIIHVIMYTYYFLSAYGPEVRKVIAPMKPWITRMQMVQFCFLILYASQNFLSPCKLLPHWIIITYISNLLLNFFLFYNFYRQEYKSQKKVQ